MPYELLIITSDGAWPSPEEIAEQVRSRGVFEASVVASGGFDDAAASPRVVLEEPGGARLLLCFEGAAHASAIARALLDEAPEALHARLDDDDRASLRGACATVTLQVSMAGKGPADGVRLLVQTADVLVARRAAVLLDPQMQLAFGGARWMAELGCDEADVRRHVVIHVEELPQDARWLHTHGLEKFSRPELEMIVDAEAHVDAGVQFLHHVARQLASGAAIRPGETVEVGAGVRLRVSKGGSLRGDLEGDVLRIERA
jgi:hypothetical protein